MTRAPDCLIRDFTKFATSQVLSANQSAGTRQTETRGSQIQFPLIRSDLETCLRCRVRSSQGAPIAHPELISAQMFHFPCSRGRKGHKFDSLMCHKMCLMMRFHRAVVDMNKRNQFPAFQRSGKLACFVIFQNLKRSDKHKIDTPRRMGKEDGGETSRGREGVHVGPPMKSLTPRKFVNAWLD